MAMEGGWAIPTLFSNYPDLDWSAVELPMGPKGQGEYFLHSIVFHPQDNKASRGSLKLIEYLSVKKIRLEF